MKKENYRHRIRDVREKKNWTGCSVCKMLCHKPYTNYNGTTIINQHLYCYSHGRFIALRRFLCHVYWVLLWKCVFCVHGRRLNCATVSLYPLYYTGWLSARDSCNCSLIVYGWQREVTLPSNLISFRWDASYFTVRFYGGLLFCEAYTTHRFVHIYIYDPDLFFLRGVVAFALI